MVTMVMMVMTAVRDSRDCVVQPSYRTHASCGTAHVKPEVIVQMIATTDSPRRSQVALGP